MLQSKTELHRRRDHVQNVAAKMQVAQQDNSGNLSPNEQFLLEQVGEKEPGIRLDF